MIVFSDFNGFLYCSNHFLKSKQLLLEETLSQSFQKRTSLEILSKNSYVFNEIDTFLSDISKLTIEIDGIETVFLWNKHKFIINESYFGNERQNYRFKSKENIIIHPKCGTNNTSTARFSSFFDCSPWLKFSTAMNWWKNIYRKEICNTGFILEHFIPRKYLIWWVLWEFLWFHARIECETYLILRFSPTRINLFQSSKIIALNNLDLCVIPL